MPSPWLALVFKENFSNCQFCLLLNATHLNSPVSGVASRLLACQKMKKWMCRQIASFHQESQWTRTWLGGSDSHEGVFHLDQYWGISLKSRGNTLIGFHISADITNIITWVHGVHGAVNIYLNCTKFLKCCFNSVFCYWQDSYGNPVSIYICIDI